MVVDKTIQLIVKKYFIYSPLGIVRQPLDMVRSKRLAIWWQTTRLRRNLTRFLHSLTLFDISNDNRISPTLCICSTKHLHHLAEFRFKIAIKKMLKRTLFRKLFSYILQITFSKDYCLMYNIKTWIVTQWEKLMNSKKPTRFLNFKIFRSLTLKAQ